MNSSPPILSAVSIFSGGGGLDLGVARAGFSTRVAVEIEKYACFTLERAKALGREVFPNHRYLSECEIVNADLRTVSSDRIRAIGRFAPGEVPDVLIGGPPCVTFSVAGRREGLGASAGVLFREFVRLLVDLQPRAFLFENVKGMVTAPDEEGRPGGAFEAVLRELEGTGYTASHAVVDAADYGVPQHRHRLLIVGSRNIPGSDERLTFRFPRPTHAKPGAGRLMGLKPWRTVEDAFVGLPPAAIDLGNETFVNHVARRHTQATIASYAATPPGKRNQPLKRDRLEWGEPAKVIRAQGKEKADGSGQKNSSHQSLHPIENRQITVREAARIQTFPDWYVFDSTFVNGYRVVGDAVPPDLATVIAVELRRQLFDNCAEAAPEWRRSSVSEGTELYSFPVHSAP